jgi:hypothetical protein
MELGRTNDLLLNYSELRANNTIMTATAKREGELLPLVISYHLNPV